jgi:stigma-specific protein Stig1
MRQSLRRSLLNLSALAAVALLAACGPTDPGGGGEGACTDGEKSCGGSCVDTGSDPDHCGSCDHACSDGAACVGGSCQSVEQCDPGATEACYNGTTGTEGLGPCHGGTRTCRDDGTGFGPCEGEVTPHTEVCGNGLDEDCTGVADDVSDSDGDGWSNCDGDCCDSAGDGCTDPQLVNPGAFEVAGNELDDDCDGEIDNAVAAACDTGLPSGSSDGMQYAAAMDLCQTTTEDSPRWGVISAQLVLPSGSGNPDAASRAIRPGFGATTTQHGASLAVLSTGHAADVNDTNPAYAPFQEGVSAGTTSPVPSDWLSANGGSIPNAPGCPDPAGGTTAHDPVMLKLRIRAPSNARSFSLSSNFFSAEFPEWVCSPYNDFFVVLLDSTWDGTPANPADKNLAIYTAPNASTYPVGVNLAYGNTGLFNVCVDGPTGCADGSVAGSTTACTSTAELVGTGFDVANPPGDIFIPGYCGASNLLGGGTGWLTTAGNVVGGEVIELRFAIWDTSDELYDSVVLLDNFQWSVDAAQPGTVVD